MVPDQPPVCADPPVAAGAYAFPAPEAQLGTSFRERLRIGTGRRALAICSALFIEALLLFLLLSLGLDVRPGKPEESITVVNVRAFEALEQERDQAPETEPEPEPSRPEDAPSLDQRPAPERPVTEEPPPFRPAEPLLRQPAPPQDVPAARPLPPNRAELPPPARVPGYSLPAAPAPRRVYGPPNSGGSSAARDSERVGTAPNGEPLYAAAWYREPGAAMLRGYLSTATGPGWGLIACRTAPDYRVEDCVGLDEYPQGSRITRAVLAAAWEFRVRPARLGGQPQIGSWVRIRIDYNNVHRSFSQ